jgi:hypothetical protein
MFWQWIVIPLLIFLDIIAESRIIINVNNLEGNSIKKTWSGVATP